MRSDSVIDLDLTVLGKALNVTVTVNGFGGEVVRDSILTKREALRLAETLTEASSILIHYGRSNDE